MPTTYTCEPYTDEAGGHRWRLVAANGQIVATCHEGYVNPEHRDEMMETLFGTHPLVVIVTGD